MVECARQGPLDTTADAFWRMMWEQNCSIVVMVTREIEVCVRRHVVTSSSSLCSCMFAFPHHRVKLARLCWSCAGQSRQMRTILAATSDTLEAFIAVLCLWDTTNAFFCCCRMQLKFTVAYLKVNWRFLRNFFLYGCFSIIVFARSDVERHDSEKRHHHSTTWSLQKNRVVVFLCIVTECLLLL